MMRSLYSGVAGLKTHQVRMDVIGNNIANVNTTAYKSSSMVFSELMSQTTQRASGPNAATGLGGVNARQMGLGVKSGAININITGQGSAQSTGNPFDIMITGENFFIVNNGMNNYFTRDGSFYVDSAGNLAMTSTGYNVMGWQVDETTGNVRQDTVTALRIMSAVNMTYPPEATSLANMSGIIDKFDTDVTSANGKVVNLNFYDNLGYEYTAKFVFKQSGDVNQYSLELDKILDSKGDEVDLGSANGVLFGALTNTQYKSGVVAFDSVAFEWNGNVLSKNGVAVADLRVLFDNRTLRDRDVTGADIDPPITYDTTVTTTVQEQLDAIAEAYGYQGSTDEFLNLLYTSPADENVNPAIPAQPDLTILKLLENLAAAGGTEAISGNDRDTPTLRTFANAAQDESTSFDIVGRIFTGTTVVFNGDNGDFIGINGQPAMTTAVLNLSLLGGNFSNITIDFSTTTMVDNKGTSTINATSGDLDGYGAGRRLGDMIGVSIQRDGCIYASYDNGMTKLLGQIATASFANASGLEKSGDNLYSSTLNSGAFDGIGVDVTANGSYMSTGQLEMSNVDLSSEFTEMITTQRGFQANSRIITVSDSMLEELTNLKR